MLSDIVWLSLIYVALKLIGVSTEFSLIIIGLVVTYVVLIFMNVSVMITQVLIILEYIAIRQYIQIE